MIHVKGCYCGNSEDKFIPTDPEECNSPCTGDPNEFCGGSWRLQVYDLRVLGDEHDHLNEMDDMQHEYTEAPTTATAEIEEEAGDALGELDNLA